jgi:multidrug efflux pump subunit AcrA (membrane-fusion protein)
MNSTPLRSLCLLSLTGLMAISLPGCTPAESAVATAASAASGAGDSRYVAMARGRVDVPGGLLRVSSPQRGVIQSWSVAQGESVQKGQVLALIDAREARFALDQAQAEQAHAAAQLDALRAKLPALQTRAKRLQQALKAGAVSGQAADDAQAAVVDAEKEIAVLSTAVAMVRQRVSQAHQMLAAATIKAPAAGRVVKRMAEVGEFVDAYSVLLHLLPSSPHFFAILIQKKSAVERVSQSEKGTSAAVRSRLLRVRSSGCSAH